MDNNTALTTIEEAPLPSLLTGTPVGKVEQATEIANALAPVINKQHLYAEISNKRHVLYEGWTTLGALLGVFPVTVWTRKTEDGWEARVEAQTLAGAIVGAAEAECNHSEVSGSKQPWKDRPEFALRSMAQTRAGSKALRMPLGFIMSLAGFDATPAEEMIGVKEEAPEPMPPVPASAPPLPGDAPNCTTCNSIMVWRFGERDGRKWKAWMCPKYKKGQPGHAAVFVNDPKPEIPERDVDANAQDIPFE